MKEKSESLMTGCIFRFNLTEKEGSADRKVPVQPLVFYSKDGKVTRYNLRKVSVHQRVRKAIE